MGCSFSAETPDSRRPEEEEEEEEGDAVQVSLSAESREAIRQSWRDIQEDISKVGVIMFVRLFETHPECKDAFFAFRDLNDVEALRASKELKAHGLRIMSIIEKTVARIDQDDRLDQLILDLGRKHYRYKALPKYYELMGQEFILAIQPVLNERWTSDLDEAWKVRRSFQRIMSQLKSKAGGTEENPAGARSRLPKLKIPAKIWKKRKPHNNNEGDELEEVQEEQLEEVSRRLIEREEELFSHDCLCEEEEDQLHRDFEALQLKLWMAINDTFTPVSSTGQLEVLRSAMASIQQQEVQDQRWRDCHEERVPRWRPQRCLSIHNVLLQNMVERRMAEAAEADSGGTDQLSSSMKRQVCRVGRCVKEDLLTVVRRVKDCYPPHMDIMNLYAALYHQEFSARLARLAPPGLNDDDCGYLLLWVNHYYPHEILKHQELDGQIKAACLGSLLQQDDLKRLEEQYLAHKEEKVKLWLNTALKKEQENWLTGRTPELIDSYYFSPLAVDIIQMMTSSLSEFNCAIRDQKKTQRFTVHLEHFLCSYVKCVEDFVKGNHSNICSVIKAQLVCEQQLRDYIAAETGNLSEEQKCRCLQTLSALRDCGHRCLTCSLHAELKKVCWSQLWTPQWLDGSLPVVNLLLDSLSQELVNLTDLKPACRESLLCELYQEVALRYVKRMMKTRMKSKEQQIAGAQQLIEDARKINSFFLEEGCSKASWLCEILCKLAEVLRLQDPASIQLELVTLARNFSDLSNAHVSALLSLKIGLSAANARSIRRSVEENRHCDVTTHSPPFFSKVKVKWINNKMNQMGLKA